MKILKYSIFIFLFLPLLSFSQKVENVYFEQAGKKIHIYYDLLGNQYDKYTVSAYCISNGYDDGKPLSNVSGDIGNKETPGANKLIVWEVLNERDSLVGNVQFKVTAVLSEFAGINGFFTDERDGKKYKWIRIGSQIWMAENLNYGKMLYGKSKPSNKAIVEKYCYEDNMANCNAYGALYTWIETMDSKVIEKYKGICPDGWHIPSNDEWDELFATLGGRGKAGKILSHKSENGFKLIAGGYRGVYGSFNNLGTFGYYWTSTYFKDRQARALTYNATDSEVFRSVPSIERAAALRCIKDE